MLARYVADDPRQILELEMVSAFATSPTLLEPPRSIFRGLWNFRHGITLLLQYKQGKVPVQDYLTTSV